MNLQKERYTPKVIHNGNAQESVIDAVEHKPGQAIEFRFDAKVMWVSQPIILFYIAV